MAGKKKDSILDQYRSFLASRRQSLPQGIEEFASALGMTPEQLVEYVARKIKQMPRKELIDLASAHARFLAREFKNQKRSAQ